MSYPRQFWYTFFSELGFLIMPCGFNWHSTTSWLFEGEPATETMLSDGDFKITYTGIDCFFYHLSATLLKQHLALFRLTDTIIRQKLSHENIGLEIPAHYHDHPLLNIRKYEGKKYLQGFSLKAFIYLISTITDQIDPMDWQKEGVHPNYLTDFDTYGCCFLSITKEAIG